MATLYNYGTLDPIPFKVTKNGVGVTLETFSTGDIQASVAGAAFANIDTEITEIGLGWYLWTPTVATQTQGEFVIINIKEASGTTFDENGIVLYTGGNANARFDGA